MKARVVCGVCGSMIDLDDESSTAGRFREPRIEPMIEDFLRRHEPCLREGFGYSFDVDITGDDADGG